MKLENAGYTVMQTPFGYFNEFKMHVAGDSLAKVMKNPAASCERYPIQGILKHIHALSSIGT